MSLEEQISELEIQSAHQEKLIADLNEVIIEQQSVIAKLESRLSVVESAVKDGTSSNIKDPSEEMPPPHY